MLEFLIPIFYLEKPTRIIVTVGNTIFGAYTSEWVVEYALVLRDMVRQLLARIGKSKPTSICPYLLHLYYVHDAIQLEDKKVYMVGESFMRHNVKSDKEEQLVDTEDPDCKSLSSWEIAELQAQQKKKEPSPPKRKLTPTSERKEKSPQEGGEPTIPRVKQDPFGIIMDALQEIWDDFSYTRKTFRATCVMVSAENQDVLLETLEQL